LKKNQNKNIGLIHIGKKEKSGIQIYEKLKQFGFKVVEFNLLEKDEKLKGFDSIDTIVVNIGTVKFEYERFMSELFEKDINVIINEALVTNQLSGVNRLSWERHLLNKIDGDYNVLPDYTSNHENTNTHVDLLKYGIKQLWILAASIGGPEAIQNFLKCFKGNEPVLFIIVQHIDLEFLPRMAEQLHQNSPFDIEVPISGVKITPAKCIIHPIDEYLQFDDQGVIELHAINRHSKYTPCIDDCTKRLSENICHCNIAIFSGMSTDGIEAAKMVMHKKGEIITQIEDSCVLSSIISGVKKSININFEGTPEQMAEYIISKC
jgi:chemotaxis response regulator CheB